MRTCSHDQAMDEPYAIRLRGILSDSLLAAFPGLDAHRDGDDIVLVGGLPDQAALHGMLAQIEALNLELLELRRTKIQATVVVDRPAAALSAGSDDDNLAH